MKILASALTQGTGGSALPCILSSITSYAVYTQLYKKGALFFPGPVGFSLPGELLPYALFGVVCALPGFLYVRGPFRGRVGDAP